MGEVIQFDRFSDQKTERALQIAKDSIHGLLTANLHFAEIDELRAKIIMVCIQDIFNQLCYIERKQNER